MGRQAPEATLHDMSEALAVIAIAAVCRPAVGAAGGGQAAIYDCGEPTHGTGQSAGRGR